MQQGIMTKASLTTSRRLRFVLRDMRAREGVSQLFRFELDVSGSAGLDIERMLGMGVTLRIDQPGRHVRCFHGIVEQAGAGPADGKSGEYQLVLVPAIAELARCGRQRVHASVTLPDLVGSVLSSHGIAYDVRLAADHPVHELVVQYNESDLDFVMRLLEHEGIFFTFKHAADGHTLVMWDDPAMLPSWPAYETHTVIGEGGNGEGILRLDPWASARVTRVELNDTDPLHPEADLSADAGSVRRGESCSTRQDYPGGYRDADQGAARAAIRLRAERAGHRTARGTAASRGIVAGHRFTLLGHGAIASNTALVPIETETFIRSGLVTAAAKLAVTNMHCSLTTTPVDEPMPLPAVERRPELHGPHSAVVVGPGGQPVHTDPMGRVQVRFAWQDEDDPAPWVRVSQAWAGQQRGMLAVPRVGDEVLVAFEHGDARRAVVVGSLYNGISEPPLSLPDERAQTLLQTRSLDDTVANRLRVDDTGGAELMAIEAGRDYRLSVDNDAFVEVGSHLAETISGDRSTTVDGDQTSTIDGATTVSLGQGLSAVVDRRVDLSSGRAMTVSSDDSLTVTAGKRIAISGEQSIVIHNQNASIELQADGDIIIRGRRVTLRADGRLTLKGADVVEQEG